MSARKNPESGQKQVVPSNGAIYCCGPLLRAVQLAGLYKDCKYFVDMSCRYSPERILADYQLFSSCKKNETSVKHLTNFVDNHFDQPGTEMEYWSPPDWRSEPSFLKQIKDPQLKKFGADLNRIWKQLGRSTKDCVRTSPLMYSVIYVPNPLIVPGGNFIEFYYWDTYWIVRGLLYSGMIQTARGMIDNLLYLVQTYKSVPCGGRIYYWGRSQPPLLTLMVKSYVEVTKDEKYAVRALPLLEMEMENFLKCHSVQVEGRTMYQYRDKSTGPRPEFYREDLASAESFSCLDEKEEHFAHLKAACESGMDFSSRWFVSPTGTNVGTLANIKTTWIVPVDLNCLIFRSCKTLAEFNTLAGKTAEAQVHRNTACGLIKAITAVLWNEERGVWLDYDLKNKKQRDFFVVTNLSPLYYHAYPIADNEKISKSVLAYIDENKLDTLPGGVPHTLSNTGEKWDYPNVWPPMMHMLIEGLSNLDTPEATEMSERWRERWVRCNYEAYTNSGFMFEKYNCEEFGRAGTGAESPSQTGFGWTNGVIIEMLAKFGNTLTSSDDAAADNECTCADNDNQESLLENCPITSEAYLEKKAQECDEMEESAQNGQEAGYCSDSCCKADENAPDVASFATSEPPVIIPCCPNIPEPQGGYGNTYQPPQPNGGGSPAQVQRSSQRGNEGGSPAQGQRCSQGGNEGGSPAHGQRSSQGGNQGGSPAQGQRSSQGGNQGGSPAQGQRSSKGGTEGGSPCGICNANAQSAGQGQAPGGGSPGGGSPGGKNASQAPQDIPCDSYYNNAQQQQATQAPGGGSPCGICGQQDAQQPASGKSSPGSQRNSQGPKAKPAEPVTDMCSVCCGPCSKSGDQGGKFAIPQPRPIEIEMEEIKCLLDLSPSEQEEMLAMCTCESKAETAITKQSQGDESSRCEDSDDSGCQAPPAKPVKMNKLFPLADDIKCPPPKPATPVSDDSYCNCDKANANKAE